MKSLEVARIVADEKKAEDYLREAGILRTFTECPHCGSKEFSSLRGTDLRCRDCDRAWSVRKDSILFRSSVSCSKFVMMVRLFEQEVPALACAKDLELNRNTVNRFYRMFREALTLQAAPRLSGEVEADESYFGGRRKGKRGRGAACKVPVFGIIERGGKVRVQAVPDVRAETLLRQTVKTVKRGSLIYTDRFRSYNGLVAHGFRHQRIDHSKRFANGKVYINGIEGFWSYAKERLQKYHGVSSRHFPLYLKELEVRYNSRGDDFLRLVLASLVKKSQTDPN